MKQMKGPPHCTVAREVRTSAEASWENEGGSVDRPRTPLAEPIEGGPEYPTCEVQLIVQPGLRKAARRS